jgi:protein SCO1/2
LSPTSRRRLAAGLLLLGACAPAESRLPVLGEAPPFVLTDARGVQRTRDELRGAVWVADFVFTRCPGPCPRLTRRMAELQREFADRAAVRLVSFTVDPLHDEPAVLADYGARFDADPSRWWFLTGPRDSLRAWIVDGFRLPVAETGTAGGAHGPILHSTRFVLVDRSGRIRGYFDAEVDQDFRALKRALRTLVGESAP